MQVINKFVLVDSAFAVYSLYCDSLNKNTLIIGKKEIVFDYKVEEKKIDESDPINDNKRKNKTKEKNILERYSRSGIEEDKYKHYR